MMLYLDVGNTALKWRYRRADGCEQGGLRHDRNWSAAVAALLKDLSLPPRVWVASVAGPQADAQLRQALLLAGLPQVHFYYSQAEVLGVVNGYPLPDTLGVDRWLAIVEAYHRFGAAIVVDCGSALTVDVVNDQGHFQGGYIVPGFAMARNALLRDTASVKAPEEVVSAGLGLNTQDCVNGGLLAMMRALVGRVVSELASGDQRYALVLTGGDAALLAADLPMAHHRLPDLVLDGLERVAVARQE